MKTTPRKQGNEIKDTVTRPEVSEADPIEKQKVIKLEVSMLIKEHDKKVSKADHQRNKK